MTSAFAIAMPVRTSLDVTLSFQGSQKPECAAFCEPEFLYDFAQADHFAIAAEEFPNVQNSRSRVDDIAFRFLFHRSIRSLLPVTRPYKNSVRCQTNCKNNKDSPQRGVIAAARVYQPSRHGRRDGAGEIRRAVLKAGD